MIQKIYFFIGVAPCRLGAANRKDKSFFRRVPVLISFLSSICVTLLQFISFYLLPFGLMSTLINYAYYGCCLVTNVTANLQCWYHESIYQNIIERIERLENACDFKFSRKLLYTSIKHRCISKAILIIGSYSISSALVWAQAWFIGDDSKKSILLASLTTFKELMSVSAVLHFTLYVDIVRFFIAELNEQIHCSPICFFVSTKVAFLKDVKLIHMDVFLLMKQVNNFFGWHLLLLTIHYLILTTYSLYWIFLTIQQGGKHYSIAGELLVFASVSDANLYRGLTNSKLLKNYDSFNKILTECQKECNFIWGRP